MANIDVEPEVPNCDQERALQLCLNDKVRCVFCTGSGGTGKTWLIKALVDRLQAAKKKVALTAATGVAATLIGGITLHSFAGTGIVQDDIVTMGSMVANKPYALKNWKSTDVLIIDEISMISAPFIDNLSVIAQVARGNNEAFGGMRILVFGDFFQLPPVEKDDTNLKFAFESKVWDKLAPETVVLGKQMRVEDPQYAASLEELRWGECSDSTEKLMLSLDRPLPDDGTDPVVIFPHRKSADGYNATMQAKISSPPKEYVGKGDSGEWPAPRKLQLKVGSQVMFVANIPPWKVVNGTVGKVIEFGSQCSVSTELIPRVEYIDTKGNKQLRYIDLHIWERRSPSGSSATFMQIPLILAWSITIHKSQGKTISKLRVDLNGTFAPGQMYVALSRVRTRNNVSVSGFSPKYAFCHPKVLMFYKADAGDELASVVEGLASLST